MFAYTTKTTKPTVSVAFPSRSAGYPLWARDQGRDSSPTPKLNPGGELGRGRVGHKELRSHSCQC